MTKSPRSIIQRINFPFFKTLATKKNTIKTTTTLYLRRVGKSTKKTSINFHEGIPSGIQTTNAKSPIYLQSDDPVVTMKQNPYLEVTFTTGWWFQPIWKIWVKLEIFQLKRGENIKYLSCHHLDNL